MKPALDEAECRAILAEYGIVAARLEEVPGYYDLNIRVTADDGQEYVLKASGVTSRAEFELQNEAIERLGKRGLPVPRLRRTKEGKALLQRGDVLLRLVTYLPGELMADAPLTPALLEETGGLIAHAQECLKGFDRPAARRDSYVWMLQNFPLIGREIAPLEEERQAVVRRVLERFRKEARPILPMLPAGVIHNDAHIWNVLVKDGKVAGLIDFGDLGWSPLICDVAIAIAHLIVYHPLELALHVLDGYRRVREPEPEELAVLPVLILARLATFAAMNAVTLQRDPENAYLAPKVGPSWTALARYEREGIGLARKEEAGIGREDKEKVSQGPTSAPWPRRR